LFVGKRTGRRARLSPFPTNRAKTTLSNGTPRRKNGVSFVSPVKRRNEIERVAPFESRKSVHSFGTWAVEDNGSVNGPNAIPLDDSNVVIGRGRTPKHDVGGFFFVTRFGYCFANGSYCPRRTRNAFRMKYVETMVHCFWVFVLFPNGGRAGTEK